MMPRRSRRKPSSSCTGGFTVQGESSTRCMGLQITRSIASESAQGEEAAFVNGKRAAKASATVYETDPGARVDRERAAAYIHHFFLSLPAKQREVFDLVDLQGHDPADVAKLMGPAPGLLGKLFKARASIRNICSIASSVEGARPMITCQECINALSTTRLSDIRSGSPVAMHYATCEACSRTVRELYLAERELASALDYFRPANSPEHVSERAIDTTYRRRRRIARAVRALLVFMGIGVSAIALELIVGDGDSIHAERIPLRCIMPSQAAGIAESYMGSGGKIETSDANHSIYLEGSPGEVAEALAQISVADNSPVCSTTPPDDTEDASVTSPDKSGTD